MRTNKVERREEIINILCNQSNVLKSVRDLEYEISCIIDEAIKRVYTRVYLINGDQAKVSRDIESKYGFQTEWRGEKGYCGIITVYVPKEKCTKALLNDFKQYDAYLGSIYGDKCREYPTVD